MSADPRDLPARDSPSDWKEGYHSNRELILFLDGQNKLYLGRIEVWLKVGSAIGGVGIPAIITLLVAGLMH